MKIRFLDPARIELHDVADYYEQRRAGLGSEFADELEKTLERIERSPKAWPPLSANTRRCRLRRFPYGVIYQVRDDEILIVAVAHGKRRPGYWRDRISE